MVRKAFDWSLSWTILMQALSPYPVSQKYILILSSYVHLGLPTKTWYGFLFFSLMETTCAAHLIFFDIDVLIIFIQKVEVMKLPVT
jgi:hypothetical protein